MTFQEYLDQNEESIRSSLNGADDPARVEAVLSDHLSRMLVLYNEKEEEPFIREAAGAMMQVVRASLGFMDVHGDVRVWQRISGGGKENGGKEKRSAFFFICLIAGVLFLAGGIFLGVSSLKSLAMLPLMLLLAAAGGVLLYLAGMLGRQTSSPAGPGSVTGAVSYDQDKILRQLRRLLLTMDHALSGLSESYAASSQASGNTSGEDISDEEDLLLLFSGLLEASYSGDGTYALDELGQIRHYLHRHQVGLSDDTGAHREWFDYVPTASPGVLRPALVQTESGKLLKKGLAGVTDQG